MTTDTSGLAGWIAWGAAGHAKVLRDALATTRLPLVAVFDNAELPSPFADVPVFHKREGFTRWRSTARDRHGFLVAIGGGHGAVRCELHDWLVSEGLISLTAIHPRAFVADSATIGAGSHVLANAAVCVDVQLGRQCIINTGATVDHESRLGHGVHVGPGAHLAGLVTVEDHAFIGTGATVLPRIRIGAGATVGAGAVVTRDVEPNTTVVGVPATVLRREA